MSGTTVKGVNLALQGGGSHGAFTWGVLDRLLEEDNRLRIEGISGTSAGAMNAAVLLNGYATGGADGAREMLERFWTGVSALGSFGLPHRSVVDQMLGNWNTDNSPATMMTDMMQRMMSPYQTNLFNLNPLRDLLEDILDIEAIRAFPAIKLFVSATNVETGRIRVFRREEVSLDVLMASACLPLAFQAVPVDGVPYWDGGYVGNPAVFPLIYHCTTPDVVLVQINPMVRSGTPDSPMEIINRINEISFNSSLMSEMRAIAFVQKLIEEDQLKNEEAARLKHMFIHVIAAEDEMRALGSASKINTDMDFLLHLKDLGRRTAEAWLTANWDALGQRSSINVKQMFL